MESVKRFGIILLFLIFAGCRSTNAPSQIGVVDYSVDAFGDETTKEKVMESIR